MMQAYKLHKLVTLPVRAYHPTIKFIGKRHPRKNTITLADFN